MEITLYVVVWRSYLEWRGTRPFTTKEDAEAHAKKHLWPCEQEARKKGDAYHYSDVQVVPVVVRIF